VKGGGGGERHTPRDHELPSDGHDERGPMDLDRDSSFDDVEELHLTAHITG
jgi:hypothetical protein